MAEHSAKIAKRHRLSFDVLSDPGNRVAGALGLVFSLPDDLAEVYRGLGLDLARFNGDDSWTLPLSGRIVIAPDGVVRSVDVDPDYTARPEPEETVELLRQLA